MKLNVDQAPRATRADVAARAGTSPTTVAYVMNDTPGVKIREETRTKVLAAAKELGYQPSFSARSMKRGKTELIGVMLPELTSQFHPFYAQMLHGLYEAASETNYHFLLLTQDREEKYQHCLRQNYVDGVVLIQSGEDTRHLKYVLDAGLPVVSLNSLHSASAPQITMDYEGAMRMAVEELTGGGARKLLYVHGSWNNQPNQRYLATYAELKDVRRRPKVTFADQGFDRYQLEADDIAGLLAGDCDGLIVDGYELARDVVMHADFAARRDSLAMVVFSESTPAPPLGEGVTILQSQPQQTGRLAWTQLVRQLDGKKPRKTVYKYPFSKV